MRLLPANYRCGNELKKHFLIHRPSLETIPSYHVAEVVQYVYPSWLSTADHNRAYLSRVIIVVLDAQSNQISKVKMMKSSLAA